MLYYLVEETIPVIQMGAFGNLSIGYYFLLIGTVFTGIITFINNLNKKVNDKKIQEINQPLNPTPEISLLNQIDKLYDANQPAISLTQDGMLTNDIQPLSPNSNNISPINGLNIEQSSLQPIPATELSPLPVQPLEVPQPLELVQPLEQSVSLPTIETISTTPVQSIQPIMQFDEPLNLNAINNEQVNPVMAEFSVPTNAESIQGSSMGLSLQPNTVQMEANNSISIESLSTEANSIDNNPVLSEFADAIPQSFISAPINTETTNTTNSAVSNGSNLDIFN